MNRHALYFTGPHSIEIREEACPEPAADELLIRTKLSAISPGTELLIYNNQIPDSMSLDSTISALNKPFEYPVKYGYANVGIVEQVGSAVEAFREGETVFSFHPHESHFTIREADLVKLPENVEDSAALLPNMETAVNFAMDGSPVIGERVAVFGQGIVGLLTTFLLSQFPISGLITIENIATRRELSLQYGANASFDSGAIHPEKNPFDLIYELTGNPNAINDAIPLCGMQSRILVGSWYGKKQAPIDLGNTFHRNRIQITSSQVSTIGGNFRPRWDKTRRLDVALNQLGKLNHEPLISHRIPFHEAHRAYELYHNHPEETLQILLTY